MCKSPVDYAKLCASPDRRRVFPPSRRLISVIRNLPPYLLKQMAVKWIPGPYSTLGVLIRSLGSLFIRTKRLAQVAKL